MMARYPEKPTKDEQEALRSFVYLFSRLYPWYVILYLASMAGLKLMVLQRRVCKSFSALFEKVSTTGFITKRRCGVGMFYP
jgi:hypothetical protein